MIKREDYLQKIRPFINLPVIKVITGIRRSGKTTFFKQIIDEISETTTAKNILKINKELLEFDFIKNYKDLDSHITEYFTNTTGKKYIFLDEVQEIIDWEKTVNSLQAKKDYDLYITGSNANLLSNEIATLLTGRFVEINMYPFSFKEYLIFKNKLIDNSNYEYDFNNYLQLGGLPALHELNLSIQQSSLFLSSLLDSIFIKDIAIRYEIRNMPLLKAITSYVFDNIGQYTSTKKITDYLKSKTKAAAFETVSNYLNYIEKTYLINKLERYNIKGKQILEQNCKYYVTDLGLRHVLIGFKSNDISQLLENVVYNELRSRGYTVRVGNLRDLEVDFIASKENDITYYQVCYLLENQKTLERELKPLQQIKDNYPKIILSMDKIRVPEHAGIKSLNLIDFLLGKVE